MFPPSPQAHLETFWRGQNRRLALALHDDILYFWEPDSPQVQFAHEEWVFAVEYQLCFSDERQITPELLADELEQALVNRRTGRRFQLTDVHTVFLREYDRQSYQYGEKPSMVWFHFGTTTKWAGFEWGSPHLFDVPLSKWIENLEEEAIDGPYGYESFVDALAEERIPYCPYTWENRVEIVVSEGTQDQMLATADSIFQLSPPWIEQVDSRPDSLAGVGALLILPCNRPSRLTFGGYIDDTGFVCVPPPYKALWDVWLDYFRPQPNAIFHREEIANGYRLFSVHLDAYGGNWSDRGPQLRELSAHEQLEIRLQLRDWLRDDVALPDERIAELLA